MHGMFVAAGAWGGGRQMEFVRKVRTDTSREMQLCKSFLRFLVCSWLCKFFQGIDKMFFISVARLEFVE